ncbi:MAG: hypothetical protein KKB02_16010 [Alphaproteobacteria bacterium]|nr:hypothetical protein [Alphaproteobacteria bacterium]
MAGRKYGDATIAEAVARRERGECRGQIAADLKMSLGAVDYHCLAQGVTPGGRPIRFRNTSAVVTRGGHMVRLFTPAEDARAQAMRIEGMGIAAIARILGRKPVSVRSRLQALARRDEVGVAA